jgi:PEP-CTERM motif
MIKIRLCYLMKRYFPALALIVLASTNLPAATSDLNSYYVQKTISYNQISIAAPLVSSSYSYLSTHVFPNLPTGVSNPSLQTPLSGPYAMSYSVPTGLPNGLWAWTSATYPTLAALDAAFPDGNYQFSIPTTSGTALTYTPTLTQTGNFAAAVPIISNTTWSGPSLTLDYTVANTISWNNPGAVSDMQLAIFGSSGDVLSFYYSGGGVTSQIIAANSLNPNESYVAGLVFQNYTTDTTQIPGVNGLSYNTIRTNFGIVPEPSTCAMLVGGLGLLGLAVRRRPAIAGQL